MARKPIELDEARHRRLLAALEAGATIKMAAAAAGVSEDTLAKWRKEKPDLQDEMNQAEAAGAVRALGVIQDAAASGTWQAAAWLLERRYPGDYGRRVPKLDEAPDLTRSLLDESLDRYRRLFDKLKQENTPGLAKMMGAEPWDGGLYPTGVIVLPAEDLEDAPARSRTKPDGGLAFS